MTAPANAIGMRERETRAHSARRRSQLLKSSGFYLFISVFVIFCLAPFIWTFLTAFKSTTTIYNVPIDYLPNPFDLSNFQQIGRLTVDRT